MASNNSTVAEQSQQDLMVYAIYVLRVISSLAIIMNICVICLMIRLKNSFRNYSYWFQITVLASEDSLNGLASFALTFYDLKLFKTNYIACSVLLCAYICTQINTLLAICCICISRFLNIQSINKLRKTKSGYRQEISIVLATVFGIVYASLPFLTLNLTTTKLQMCRATILFGSQVRAYKLLTSLGLIVPFLVINILYGVCLLKLKRINSTVTPLSHHAVSNLSSGSRVTEEISTNKYITSPAETGRDSLQIEQFVQAKEQHVAHGKEIINLAHIERSRQISSPSSYLPVTVESVSSPITHSSFKTMRKSHQAYSQSSRSTREAQCRAIKLLGIVLFTSNIATIIPLAFMLRDVILSVNIAGGGTSLGLVFLSLNSLVDAFVYGLYAREIRAFLLSKLKKFRQLLCC